MSVDDEAGLERGRGRGRRGRKRELDAGGDGVVDRQVVVEEVVVEEVGGDEVGGDVREDADEVDLASCAVSDRMPTFAFGWRSALAATSCFPPEDKELHARISEGRVRRRALALRMGPDADAAQCGTTRWALARALWPSDRDRAKALAVAALEDLRSADAQTELPGEIAAWLSERGVPVDP